MDSNDRDVRSGPPDGDGSSEALEKLERENAELRRALAEEHEHLAAPTGRRQRWRTVLAVALVLLGALLALLSVPTIFARNQLLDTDRFVNEVAPLSKNPAVASVVATQVTNELFTQVNVQQRLQQALPPRADFIAAPLTSALHGFVQNETYKVVRSDRFNTVWRNINELLHKQVVAILTGSNQTALRASNDGVLTLDLHTAAVKVQQELVSRGVTVFAKIPTDRIGGTVTLMRSTALVKAQRGTRALQHLAVVLPLLALVCWAAAIAVSKRRRRTVIHVGIALAAVMALLAVALGIARTLVVDAAAGHALTPEAAQAVFGAILGNLLAAIRVLFFIGAAVVIVAWIVGPAAPAVAFRRAVGAAARWIGRSARALAGAADRGVTGAAERGIAGNPWIAANLSWLRAGIIGLALLVLIWWGNPGLGGVLVVVLVAAAAIAILQLAGAGAASGGPPGGPAPGGPPPGDPSGPSGGSVQPGVPTGGSQA